MTGVSFIYPHYLWLGLFIPLMIILALIGRKAVNHIRQWSGIVLRSILLTLIIFALAGFQIHMPSRQLTVVFILDASDSISPIERSRGEEYIRQAISGMPAGDRSAIVVFGEDALVEQLVSEDSSLGQITSDPISTRTDIASALQLAMALFPDEGARRLVLISDGRENLGLAMKQAEIAAYQEIELQYIPLGDLQNEVEVQVSALEAPSGIHEGQEFDLDVIVESTTSVGATLRIFDEDELIHSREVNLLAATNRFSVTVQNPESGFRRFKAQIIPDTDHWLQNNEASAYTVVYGPPSILLVEGSQEEGNNLQMALEAANMRVHSITPEQTPTTLPELAEYDTVILANVPADRLPAGAMEALPIYVRDLGKGLLMTGGENTFGAGGYLRTPLETAMPVYMDVKSRELAANLALIVAVDKSGSMGRCHCDNPDLNQTYTAVETGQPKVDIAKEAIMRSASVLGDQDYLGVVAFDDKAHWALDPQLLPGQGVLERAIGAFKAEGQTNMYTGVTEAYQALEGVNAKRKHIILMTDGWVRTGELNSLAEQMREEGITLSVIATGEGSAEYLEALSEAGGGRYYPAVDMMSVPDVFLKETVKSVGEYIIEEPFYPLPGSTSPALRGIDEIDLPGLYGYNGTSPKSTARMDLLTPRGDPLLASWQYGLGRAAAWTSDFKGQWASDWVQWSDFPKFSAQLVNWLLPSPQVEGLDARVEITQEGISIQLSATDEEDHPLNYLEIQGKLINPELVTSEFALKQVGAGQYEMTTLADQPGAYLVWLGIKNDQEPMGQLNLGLVVPFSPEYRSGGVNYGLLEELARVTGGSLLEQPVKAFIHNLPALDSSREIWQILLLITALLFPIDVALRRLVVTQRDIGAVKVWVLERMNKVKKPVERQGPQIFNTLFTARDRAKKKVEIHTVRTEVTPQQRFPQGAASENINENNTSHATAQEPLSSELEGKTKQNSQDPFSRLREAKRRAKK